MTPSSPLAHPPVGIHHAAVNVTDWDASMHFYRDVLGFELLGEGEATGPEMDRATGYAGVRLRFAMLRVGEQHFELVEYLDPKPGRVVAERHDGGQAHISFKVPDVAATYDELVGRGVRFLSAPVRFDEPVPVGGAFVYAVDPNGVLIEFIEDVDYSGGPAADAAPKHMPPPTR